MDGIKFDWDEANVAHIARHGITPVEFEEAFINSPSFLSGGLQRGEYRETFVGITRAKRLLHLVVTYRRAKRNVPMVRAVTAWPLAKRKWSFYLGKFNL